MSIGITEEHRKEKIGSGYFRALVAYAGYNISEPELDYGVDYTVREVAREVGHDGKPRYVDMARRLDFQLKSTVNYEDDGEYIKYDLEAKTYNDLINEKVSVPTILVLYTFPRDDSEWINISEKHSKFRNCAWWINLKGLEKKDNSDRVRIYIPKNQILTKDSFDEIMLEMWGEESC